MAAIAALMLPAYLYSNNLVAIILVVAAVVVLLGGLFYARRFTQLS